MPEKVGKTKRLWHAVSEGLAWAPIRLPFVAVIFFVFDKRLETIWKALGLNGVDIPSLAFVEKQYDVLLGCDYVANAFDPKNCKWSEAGHIDRFDFELFKLFFLIALTLSVLRIVTGVVSLQNLDSYLEFLKTQRKTVRGTLGTYALLGLFGMFASVNFKYVSDVPIARYLIEHSTRAFLCLHTFLFCGAAAFLAEGILFVIWAAIRRRKLLESASGLSGERDG